MLLQEVRPAAPATEAPAREAERIFHGVCICLAEDVWVKIRNLRDFLLLPGDVGWRGVASPAPVA